MKNWTVTLKAPSDFLAYSLVYDKNFLKRLKKLRGNSPEIYTRLMEKMGEIADNPKHYKPLRNVLRGKRRAHVGSFVVIFSIDEKCGSITFLEFAHHDEAYR